MRMDSELVQNPLFFFDPLRGEKPLEDTGNRGSGRLDGMKEGMIPPLLSEALGASDRRIFGVSAKSPTFPLGSQHYSPGVNHSSHSAPQIDLDLDSSDFKYGRYDEKGALRSQESDDDCEFHLFGGGDDKLLKQHLGRFSACLSGRNGSWGEKEAREGGYADPEKAECAPSAMASTPGSQAFVVADRVVTAVNLYRVQFPDVLELFGTCGDIRGLKLWSKSITVFFTTKDAATKALEFDGVPVRGYVIGVVRGGDLGPTYEVRDSESFGEEVHSEAPNRENNLGPAASSPELEDKRNTCMDALTNTCSSGSARNVPKVTTPVSYNCFKPAARLQWCNGRGDTNSSPNSRISSGVAPIGYILRAVNWIFSL